jgi:large subunit ribosomal protein L25
MSQACTLDCQPRNEIGTAPTRRLRLNKQVPAILYGANQPPQPIQVAFKDLIKQLENESFYSQIITLNLEGNAIQVLLKDLQRHPAKDQPTHADFLRFDATQPIRKHVPLHFINEDKCIGVKMRGGLIAHSLSEVEILCLPSQIPSYIEVDMTELDIGDALHLSDLKLPEGVQLCELLSGKAHDLNVAQVNLPRGSTEGSEASGAAGA